MDQGQSKIMNQGLKNIDNGGSKDNIQFALHEVTIPVVNANQVG